MIEDVAVIHRRGDIRPTPALEREGGREIVIVDAVCVLVAEIR